MNMSPAENRPRLTVATIVRNDVDGLTQTLQSVEQIADEIIIVDTGSSDATCEIARQHGAIVKEIEWSDDFSAARNVALQHHTGDWILWLDSGETLNEENAQGLRAEVDQGLDAGRAYMMMVQLPPAEGVVAAEQIAQLRLVPADSRIRYQGRVRESMLPAVDNIGLTLEGLPYRIRRSSRDHELQVKLLKARRNLALANLEISEAGRLPHLLNCIAEALQSLGEHHDAEQIYREAIAGSQTGTDAMLEAYYGVLTSLDGQPESRPQQIALCVEALEHFPLDAQLLCAMGGYLQGEGRLDLAERCYRTVIEHGQVNPLIWHVEEIQEIAAVCLSLILQLQQQEEAAIKLLEQTSQRFPNSQRVRRALIETHVKAGNQQVAAAQVEYLGLNLTQQELLRSAVTGACLAARKDWLSARTYLQTAHQGGCRDLICLRWLSLTYLVLGQHQQTGEILDQWQQIEPSSVEVAQYRAALEDAVQAAVGTQPSSEGGPTHLRIDGQQSNVSPTSKQPQGVPHRT